MRPIPHINKTKREEEDNGVRLTTRRERSGVDDETWLAVQEF